MTISIRKATKDDIPTVYKMMNVSFKFEITIFTINFLE